MTAVQTASLAEVAEVVRGVSFSKSEATANPAEGFLPVLRAGNIQDRLVTDSDLVFVPSEKVRPKQVIRRGDIVICTSSGSSEVVGKTAYAEMDWNGSFGAFCAGIRVKPSKADPTYIFHYLQSPHFRSWTQKSSGANIKNIRKSELDLFEVPLPSLSEQRRIAAILNKAESLQKKRRDACELARQFLRSAFLEMFGDPAKNPRGFKIEIVAQHLSKERAGTQSGPFGSALKKHEYVDEGIPVWGVDSVQQFEFVAKPKLFITENKFAQLERYRVLPGDVLISRAGTVGRMCVAQPMVDRSIISTNLVRVVLNTDTLLPEYFVALFTYVPHRLGALKANNKDNAFTFLNPKTLRALEIPIPPMDLQKKFMRLAESTESHVAKMNKQLDGLDELSLSLAQRAFRGEL